VTALSELFTFVSLLFEMMFVFAGKGLVQWWLSCTVFVTLLLPHGVPSCCCGLWINYISASSSSS
jgi:hypothetical protein